MPYLSHNYRSPKKSRLRTLKEAGAFFGFSMLAIMLTLFILGWAAYALQSQAATGINQQLNYQGKLMTTAGVQVSDASYNFRFRIYDAASGGTVLWTERWTSTTTQITTVNGVFSAALGSLGQADALSNINWNSDSLYLQVDLDADGNGSWEESFATRKRLTSTPYAFNANQLNGFSATSTAAVANYIPVFDSNLTLNLFNGGVSSTRATTSALYFVPQTSAPDSATGKLYYDSSSNAFKYYNGSSWTGIGSSGGGAAWESIFGATALTPTSSVGFFVNASSTVAANFRVDGNATVTSSLWIGGATTTQRLDLAGGDLFIQNDVEVGGTTYFQDWAPIKAWTPQHVKVGQTTGAYFSVNNYNNTQTLMTVMGGSGTDLGYVGVGDSTPLSLFTVGSGDNFRIDSSGNATSSGWFNIGSADVVGTLGSLIGNGDLYVGRNATTVGNLTVGGLVTSTAGLYTQGNSRIGGTLNVGATSVVTGDAMALGIVGSSSGAAAGGISLKHLSEGSTWRIEIGGSSNTYSGGLWFTDESTRKMVIDSSGNLNVLAGYATSTTGLYTQSAGHFGNNLTIDGSVGIGNSSPNSLLQLGAASAAYWGGLTYSGTPDLFVTNTVNNDELSIGFYNADGVNNYRVKLFLDDATGNYGFYSTRTSGSNNFVIGDVTSEYFRVSSGGSVGINNTSPDAKLHVTGDVKFTGNASTTGWFNIGTANPLTTLGSLLGAGDLYVGRNATITGALNVDSATLFVDTGNNRVGVGQSAPISLLDVRGSGTTGYILVGDNGAQGNDAVGIGYSTTGNNAHQLQLGRLFSTDSSTFQPFLTIDGNISSGAAGYVGIGDTSPLSLFTVGSGDKFRIDSSGNATSSGKLVIGITNPTGPNTAGDLLVGNNATITGNLVVSGYSGFGSASPVSNATVKIKNASAADVYSLYISQFNTSGNTGYGVYASTTQTYNPSSPKGYGVYGSAKMLSGVGGGASYGVYGAALNEDTVSNSYGVYGSATGNVINYGVYGSASGGTSNYAVYASGDSYVSGNSTTTGNISVGSSSGGNSVIDLMTSGVRKWIFGVNTGDSNNFVMATSTLGTNNVLTLSEVNGAVYFPKVYEHTTANAANVYIDSAGRIYRSTSSLRYKTDVDYNDVNGDLVYQLQPASYRDKTTGQQYIGFIAEDVALVEPRLVLYDAQGRPDALQYGNFVSLLTKAIQDQKKTIESLAAKVTNLTVSSTSTTQTIVNNYSAPISQGGSNFNSLSVTQSATFYGTMYVVGEAGFSHKVVFDQDIEVKGKIYASADQAGTVSIKAGATSTEVVFNNQYEVTPKVVITPQLKLEGRDYWISDKTPEGFRINVDQISSDMVFDWIALAVKGMSQPPLISDFITSLNSVGIGIPVELWAKVTDPDTADGDLTYSWRLDPNIGTVDGASGLVNWQVNNPVNQDTDVTITVTVSDGSNSVSKSKVVKVLAGEQPSQSDNAINPVIEPKLGCTDSNATNYDPAASQDDDSCFNDLAQTATSSEPIAVVGCTDSSALNFNPLATSDDGTCQQINVSVTDSNDTSTITLSSAAN